MGPDTLHKVPSSNVRAGADQPFGALMKVAFFVMLTILAAPSLAAAPKEITTAELAEILSIKFWRVPVAATGFQWTIDVADAVTLPKDPQHLSERVAGAVDAKISIRPLSDDEYEFVLNQGSDSSSGSFVPCREPEGSKSLCEMYSIKFEQDPVCLPGCKAFVVATLESSMRPALKRQIVISQTERLVFGPSDGTTIIPIK